MRLFFAAATIGAIAWATHARANTWTEHARIVETGYRHHPNSVRYRNMYGEVLEQRGISPAQRYRYWRRYLEQSRNLVPLIKMALILVGTGQIQDAGAGLPSNSAARGHPSESETLHRLRTLQPFLTAQGDTEALHLIDRVVLRRLDEAPISWESAVVFSRLVECMRGGRPACMRLHAYHARWSKQALMNLGNHVQVRAEVAGALGRAYEFSGAPDDAEHYYAAAFLLAPGDLSSLAGRIWIKIRRRQIEDAGVLLRTYAGLAADDPRWQPELERMRSALAEIETTTGAGGL